jgi:hypothetical protein
MRKTRLELDTLAVESFTTTVEGVEARGTVEGHLIEPTPPERPCTCNPTDLCKTAYYWCGTGQHTIHSCDYTYNGSCAVTA